MILSVHRCLEIGPRPKDSGRGRFADLQSLVRKIELALPGPACDWVVPMGIAQLVKELSDRGLTESQFRSRGATVCKSSKTTSLREG